MLLLLKKTDISQSTHMTYATWTQVRQFHHLSQLRQWLALLPIPLPFKIGSKFGNCWKLSCYYIKSYCHNYPKFTPVLWLTSSVFLNQDFIFQSKNIQEKTYKNYTFTETWIKLFLNEKNIYLTQVSEFSAHFETLADFVSLLREGLCTYRYICTYICSYPEVGQISQL